MLTIHRIVIWAAKRAVEIWYGACLLLLLGPNTLGRPNINIEDIRQDIGLVVIFMIYSGYFVTTFGAESIFHKHELIKKFWFGNALFALHGGIFAVFASDDNIHWTLLVFLGLGGVTFAGLLVESASVCFGHFRGHNS